MVLVKGNEKGRDSIGEFIQAIAIDVDPSGIIYIIDGGTNELLKLSAQGKVIARAGGYGWTGDALVEPKDIIAPNGLDVYITDYGNHRILRFDRYLNFVSSFPKGDKNQEPDRLFGYPLSIALSEFGELFILDGENSRIIKLNSNNEIERSFGGISGGGGRLKNPIRVRLNKTERVYVQDGNTLVVFDFFGNYLTTIGRGMFHQLGGFKIYKDSLFLLDACCVFKIHQSSNTLEKIVDPFLQYPKNDGCSIIDFAVNENKLFLLTEHHILVINRR